MAHTSGPAQLIAAATPGPSDPLGIGFFSLDDGDVADDGDADAVDGAASFPSPTTAGAHGGGKFLGDEPSHMSRLHAAKLRFNAIHPSLFSRARAACNPHECLGSGPFVNRSALKLVNLDHALDLVATAQGNVALRKRRRAPPGEPEPSCRDDAASVSPGGLLFVDLCGAPGGFSEYLLWRGQKRGDATHGWGITLGADNGQGTPCAWRVPERRTGATSCTAVGNAMGPPPSSFNICWGEDGTGDLYSAGNLHHFAAAVHRGCTELSGICNAEASVVDAESPATVAPSIMLVVADGGFNAARNQLDQEAVMTPLVVAEVLAGLLVLAPGGRYRGRGGVQGGGTLSKKNALVRHFRLAN